MIADIKWHHLFLFLLLWWLWRFCVWTWHRVNRHSKLPKLPHSKKFISLRAFRTLRMTLFQNKTVGTVCSCLLFLLRVHLFFITIWQLNFDSILSAFIEFPKLVMGLRTFVAWSCLSYVHFVFYVYYAYYVPYFIWRCWFQNFSEEKDCMGGGWGGGVQVRMLLYVPLGEGVGGG